MSLRRDDPGGAISDLARGVHGRQFFGTSSRLEHVRALLTGRAFRQFLVWHIFTDISFTSGATPLMLPPEAAPDPAIKPATNVP